MSVDCPPSGPKPVSVDLVVVGPKLKEQLVRYFGCRFQDLFEVVFVNPETNEVRVLHPASSKP